MRLLHPALLVAIALALVLVGPAFADELVSAADAAEIQRLLKASRYRDARASLAKIEPRLENFAPALRDAYAKLLKEVAADRERWLIDAASKRFWPLVEREINRRVRLRRVDAPATVDWARLQLSGAVFGSIAKSLALHDDVTPDEARSAWRRRGESPWRRVAKPARLDPGEPLRIPPRWWKEAGADARAQRILYVFVRSNAADVTRKPDRSEECRRCRGAGTVDVTTDRSEPGVILRRLCPACEGTQRVLVPYAEYR